MLVPAVLGVTVTLVVQVAPARVGPASSIAGRSRDGASAPGPRSAGAVATVAVAEAGTVGATRRGPQRRGADLLDYQRALYAAAALDVAPVALRALSPHVAAL